MIQNKPDGRTYDSIGQIMIQNQHMGSEVYRVPSPRGHWFSLKSEGNRWNCSLKHLVK